MNESKKDLIINAFQKMDLSTLDILLDNNKTYQEATKEIFLKKIEEVFLKFKNSGDDKLLSYKGFCNENGCNTGCRGYSFIGNVSRNHIDLIFEETEDDFNDIYNCTFLQLNDETIHQGNYMKIKVCEDEKADFKPSIDLLITLQKHKSASEEILQYQDKIIGREIYSKWVQKHKLLSENSFDYISGAFSTISYSESEKFFSLYFSLDFYEKCYIYYYTIITTAIEDYNQVIVNNEKELLKWLVKYEEVYMYIYFEQPENHSQFKALKINIVGSKDIDKFKSLFDEHYWDILKKYTTFSIEEERQYLNEDTVSLDIINSLTYHLKQRGTI